MRSEFEKLPQIENHLHNVVFDEVSNEYLAKKMGHLPFEFSEWFLNGSWTIYQHQQSKVDELQAKLDVSEKTRSTLYEENVDLKDKNVKLQKRVDAVQALAERWKAYKGLYIKQIGLQNCANELEQALKGGMESKPSDKNKPA